MLSAIAAATEIPLGVSVGVAEWNGGSAVELFGAAEEALREAKRSGGGRIVDRSALGRPDGLMSRTKSFVRPRRGRASGPPQRP